MNDSIALSTRETSAKSSTTQCLWILMDKIDRCFLCCRSWKMSRVQFEIEQDEEANVFVASWDDRAAVDYFWPSRSFPTNEHAGPGRILAGGGRDRVYPMLGTRCLGHADRAGLLV